MNRNHLPTSSMRTPLHQRIPNSICFANHPNLLTLHKQNIPRNKPSIALLSTLHTKPTRTLSLSHKPHSAFLPSCIIPNFQKLARRTKTKVSPSILSSPNPIRCTAPIAHPPRSHNLQNTPHPTPGFREEEKTSHGIPLPPSKGFSPPKNSGHTTLFPTVHPSPDHPFA
jgi:hypothetical protein